MRYLLIAFALMCLCSVTSYGREKASGWCEDGNYTVAVSGINSTTRVQRSFPSCTVTVYLAGTTTLASIFSDNAGTVKANPFTAATSGQWFFFADNGTYDIRFSGGGITAPFTLFNNQIGPTVVDCSTFPGTTGGAKIASCLSSLPSTGGVADATNITGPQTITQNIFSGVTKPVTLLLGAATYTISAAQVITSNNSRLSCRSTVMVKSGTINMWTISGADDTFEDCIIDGGGAGMGEIIQLTGTTRAMIRHNTITDYPADAIAVLSNTSDSRIINNTALGSSFSGHNLVLTSPGGPIANIVVDGNRFDSPFASTNTNYRAVKVVEQNGGGDIGYLTFTNNIVSTGVQSFCFEAGAFNSVATSFIHDIVVTGNTCTMTAANNLGGYSIGAQAKNVVVSNNTFEDGGFGGGIGAIEISGGIVGFAVIGNVIRNTSTTAGVGISVSNLQTEDGSFSGNTITGSNPTSTAIYIGTSVANGLMRKIAISNNIVEFASGGSPTNANAIWVQCNFTSATCTNITITGNILIGGGLAGQQGVKVDGGQTSGNNLTSNVTISGNSVYNFGAGIGATGNGITITNNAIDTGNVNGAGALGCGNCVNFNISNNTVTSTTGGVLNFNLAYGINIENSANISDGIIANNQINGSAFVGVRIQTDAAATAQRITVSGNTFNMHIPGTVYVIQISAQTSGSTIQDILVTGNTITGDNITNNGNGIAMGVGTGAVMQRVTISNNTFNTIANCIYAGSGGPQITFSDNVFINCTSAYYTLTSPARIIDYNGIPFSFLPASAGLANGSIIYVSDATIANPCAAGGTGAILKRLNGVNVCN